MSFGSEAIDPVEKCINSIALVVWIFHWFNIHINSRCKIVNFWNPVHMVLTWVTSHFSILVEVWMHYSKPHHDVLSSFQVRQVSHINIYNSWRFIKWNLVGTSFQFVFVVEQINNTPCVSLILRRICGVEVIIEIVFLCYFRYSSRISSQKIPSMTLFFFSLCLLNLLWSWSLNLKYKHCVWMGLNISDNMIDIINDLGKHRVSCVIDFCNVNNSRFKYCHSSLINPVNNLHFSEHF